MTGSAPVRAETAGSLADMYFLSVVIPARNEAGNIAAAARYGNAAAGLSVTQAGTAPSMPARRAIDRLLKTARARPAAA